MAVDIKVTLIGQVANEPVHNFSAKGVEYAKFSMVEESYDFKTKQRTDKLWNITFFAPLAEWVGANSKKGDFLEITGKLNTRLYMGDIKHEVIGETCENHVETEDIDVDELVDSVSTATA